MILKNVQWSAMEFEARKMCHETYLIEVLGFTDQPSGCK